jgi:tetratricopeptide (TPR) repeat protein
MKVPARLFPALILGATIATAGLLVPAVTVFAQQKQTNSPKLAAPLKAASEDLKNKKYSDAITKLREAEGIAGKTPYDQHLINDMLSFAYIRTNNYADAAKTMEAELNDGFVPPADVPQKVKALAEINYNLKNYDKAIEYGTRAVKDGYADEAVRTIVGQSYYLKGDWKNTYKYEEGIADAAIKAGQTPSNETLKLIYSACVKLQDEACQKQAVEKMVRYYPTPETWAQLLYTIRKDTSGNDADTFQTYRLMLDTDVLKDPSDYTEMAELALDAGSPGDAQRVLEKAQAKNVFTDQRTKDRSQRLLDTAKKRATSDQAALPKLEKEADAATTGEQNVKLGTAYFGYGQYDKAVDQLSKGLSKGGVKNEADARLTLGIAQLKAGHKDDAVKTFKTVKGDPALERLASLWGIHAIQGTGTAVSQSEKPKGTKAKHPSKVARAH